MQREPHTPGRRFKDCRIMMRPWRVPTMIAFPPPPPDAAVARPLLALPRVKTPVEAERRVVRGPSTRRRRDCLFLPDMEVAMQIFEARRRAEEMEREAVARHVHPHRRPQAKRYLSPFEDPMVLGMLMLVVPPLAVTMVWSSSRFPRAAQIALTVYGALTTLVGGAVIVAALL
ncbi:MAG TPA: hypothetical protein VGG39_34550 [Polyangiaceae bacterium]|jgi:hypothetical protein